MVASLILAGVAAATSAAGAIYKGQAEGKAADYNSQIANQQAVLARQQGAEQSRRFDIQSRRDMGSIRSGFGGSGVSMAGSVLDVLGESAANAELDSLTIQHGAELKARGYESDARMSRFRGKTARTSGFLSASGELLKGASSMVKKQG
jgi:hypothetical protein